ncbi:MAG: hypothetical protein K5919_03745 [Clostridiales bacterium]|nr:hypothetical protein [Clostridiales bacterium]
MKKWISMLLIAALCLGLRLGASAQAVTEADAVSSATRQTEAQTARKGNGGRGRTAKPAQSPDAPGAEQPNEAIPEGETPAAPTESEAPAASTEKEPPAAPTAGRQVKARRGADGAGSRGKPGMRQEAQAGDRQKQQNAAVRVEILEVGDGWVKLNVNGKTGYVKLQLLLEALTENPPDVEVKN